jgi:hypothetical protein
MKQAYSKIALGSNAVWHKCFAQGRDSLEDEHTNHPRMVRSEFKIQENEMLMLDSHFQVAVAAAVGMSHDTCHRILSDNLNMSCVTQHRVLHVQTQN